MVYSLMLKYNKLPKNAKTFNRKKRKVENAYELTRDDDDDDDFCFKAKTKIQQ